MRKQTNKHNNKRTERNLSKNQLDAQYLCFIIRLLRLLHPSTCFEQ
jgi:hypothetical protein